MRSSTIPQYFSHKLLLQLIVVFPALALVAVLSTLVISRNLTASEVRRSAVASAQAFRDRILDGDIRSVEPQLKQLLEIKSGETLKVLNSAFEPVYKDYGFQTFINSCPNIDEVCFDRFWRSASIVVPISISSDLPAQNFLLLSRSISIDWMLFAFVLGIFFFGYLIISLGLLRASKKASTKLSREIAHWATHLKNDPKSKELLVKSPFLELEPLRAVLCGLGNQIEELENVATEKAKLLLLRGIAHDLLTPVARLQLYLGVLEADIGESKHADTFNEMKDSLSTVVSIASQVKFLNSLELNPETYDLVESCKSEIKALLDSDVVASKKIDLKFKSDCERVETSFSKAEISRILINLIRNSADASSVGQSIEVEIENGGKDTMLSVRDFGEGIPKLSLKKVFDPNFTMKPGTGTGLGLSVVKQICEYRKAKVNLVSSPNFGTTVKILISKKQDAHV